MLSAPPVLVEPNAEMFAIEPSPAMQQRMEWAIQTPEASPVWVQASSKTEDEHLSCFKRACQPLFEQMLTRIASHADILENAQPLASRQLIETLCQPYFDQISGKLHDQISGMDDDTTDIVAAKVAGESSKSKAGKRLGRWAEEEEESTDAEEGSAFATLLSSDGEGNDVECRTEQGTSSGQISHTLSSEEDSESAFDAEKSSMVCRHWKTKGWCRFDAQCKFLHPDHKRGVTVKGGAELELPCSRSRASARKNRGKRNSAKQHQEFAALDLQQYSACVPCAPGMWYVESQFAH